MGRIFCLSHFLIRGVASVLQFFSVSGLPKGPTALFDIFWNFAITDENLGISLE